MTEEIKPCPFCGSEAYYSFIEDGIWIVRCFACGAQVSKPLFTYSKERMIKGRSAVIQMWNNRVDETKTIEKKE